MTGVQTCALPILEDHVRDGESVDAATERVYKFVENKLIEKTREVEEELKGGK